jgi:hypothetical protein
VPLDPAVAVGQRDDLAAGGAVGEPAFELSLLTISLCIDMSTIHWYDKHIN